ncbi:hypothetical protein [Novosphingobium sp. PASSN1]|uniref:hypothetical protein n=1 Tax=Novosphingobium sp. PASSN1 TaxID=2015561 RepID=UPI0025E1C8E0|nr:hypothetical protein [Novosphingobium sp. PASSN1]
MQISSYAGSLAGKVDAYRKYGQQEAAKNRPPTQSTYPDTHEVTLKAEADKLVADEQRIFNAIMSEADKAIVDVQSKLTVLDGDIQQALADKTLAGSVDAALAGDRSALIDSAAERIQHEVALRAFQAENGIRDPAHYPESLIWHWAIILALALAETIANAFFYQNDNGLVGGLMVALFVAAVNMGTATGLGNLFRYKNRSATSLKVLGWASLALFIPLTLFCNALFAAFRSAYQMLNDPQDLSQLRDGFAVAQSEAARIFVLDFSLKDLSSFLLFMTGICLSILAFWKGYTSDDPFPGYSKRDRALKAAKQVDDGARALLKQKIKDLMHAHLVNVQRLSSEAATIIATISRRISETAMAKRTLLSNTQAIQLDYQLVLDGYRQANLAIRGTNPPDYFSTQPTVTDTVNADGEQERTEHLKAVMANVEALQARYREDLGSKIHELQSHSSEIMGSMFDKFIAGVEADAKDLITQKLKVMPDQAL